MNCSEYKRRINLVIDYIEQHLQQKLDLDLLASVACFSPFHFHRIFKVETGETLNDFVRRLRLEKAAGTIIHSSKLSMTEVAYMFGFSSSAVFSRAFRDFFGISPTEWSLHDLEGYMMRQQALVAHAAQRNKMDVSLLSEPRMESFKSQKIVYFRETGSYHDGTILKAWEALYDWAQERRLLSSDYMLYGIYYDDPYITPQQRCRYDACIVVPHDFQESGSNTTLLPEGLFAVFAFYGLPADMTAFYDAIYKYWMPDSRYEPDDRAAMERYLPSHVADEKNNLFSCDVCIPVMRRN